MKTIRKKLSIILLACSIISIILTSTLVITSINTKFKKYMVDIQNKRNERVVEYFEELYKKEGRWTSTSGIEMQHEAYMGNYCLNLLDVNKHVVWYMDPSDLKLKQHFVMMQNEPGVYVSNLYDIKVNNKVVGYISIGQYSSVLMSEEDYKFKQSIYEVIVVSAVLTIFIVIVISLYISKDFSEPIKSVADISVKLSEGDYSARAELQSNIKELENLKESINALGEKLSEQNNLRKRLVSDISHELRTPLNVLQNNLEAMIDGIFPVTEDRLVALNNEVTRFGKLLVNLNMLKDFEAEDITLHLQKIDLDKFIKGIHDDFAVSLKERKIAFDFDIQEDRDFTILGDVDQLKQVFINLMSNAIKFTPAKGQVRVNLSANRNHVIYSIEDTGIGIAKEDIPFIFERLYRGDKSRHQIEGTGIGLTVVKKILLLHEAKIEVESEVKKGSKFTLFFKKIEQ